MRNASAIVILVLCVLIGSTGSWAAPSTTGEQQMLVGESITLDFTGLSKAAVADPKVVDIAVISTSQLLLNAKGEGSTTLDAWDSKGQRRYVLVVRKPGPNMAELVAAVNKEIASTGAAARDVNGTVLLEGTVKDADTAKRVEAIASALAPAVRNLLVVTPVETPLAGDLAQVIIKAMAPTKLNITASDKLIVIQGSVTPEDAEKLSRILAGITRLRVVTPGTSFDATAASISSDDLISVINLVTTTSYDPRQLLVRARVVDVDRKALSELGVEWGQQFTDDEGNVTVRQPIIFGEARLTPLAANEGGPLRRLGLLGATLTALITQNKARILSEPNVLVMEGQKANIHLGGEIPIPIVQSVQGTGNSITVQWKRFGVDLDIEGRIGADGKTVDLMVSPEVSELDFANAIVAAGITIPALRSRSATTKVHIPAGETLVIGGLLQSEQAKVVRRIPLLSDLPIIGQFFKRTDKTNAQRELIILVTPEIVTASELTAQGAAEAAASVIERATQADAAKDPAPAPAPAPAAGNGGFDERRHDR